MYLYFMFVQKYMIEILVPVQNTFHYISIILLNISLSRFMTGVDMLFVKIYATCVRPRSNINDNNDWTIVGMWHT